jgi:hypothetical protein
VAAWLAAACTAIFAVVAEAAVVAVVAVVAAATADAVASESILICADAAAGAAAAGELAAMAAAAIASGAVALPDGGVAAGEFVGADVTGIATATGFGVVADGAAGWPKAAGSGVEAFSEDGFSGDFAAPALAKPDFVRDRWTASALAEALASEACWAAAFLPVESLLAVRSAAAALREPALSGAAAALSDGRGAADGGCAVGAAESLPVSAGMLESTSVPKLSLLCEASGRAGFGAAVWKDMLVAASDVTLYTGGLSR